MCHEIEEALIQNELHTPPRLFFNKELSKEDKDKAKEIATRHSITVVEEEGEATHILHPQVEPDQEGYCRPVFKKGDKCLIHFYRIPVMKQFQA